MRVAKPFWKATHKCHYVRWNGTQVRLDPDRQKAIRMWDDMRAEANNSDPLKLASPRLTVADLFAEYLDWCEKHNRERTYEDAKIYLVPFAARHGNVRVRDLKKNHLTRWLDLPHADNWGPTTKFHAISVIKRPFGWALEEGIIPVNPFTKFKFRGAYQKHRCDDAYIDAEQWQKIINAINAQQKHWNQDTQSFVDYITTIKQIGCRPQEIRKVEAKWLDRKALCWVFPPEESKGGEEKQIKRIVHLTPEVFAICQRLALKYPEGPLFRGAYGQPWTNRAVHLRFLRLKRKTGVACCMYALRHTFATDAIIRGVDIMFLKELMGHTSLQMLTRIYQHVQRSNPAMKDALAKAQDQTQPGLRLVRDQDDGGASRQTG